MPIIDTSISQFIDEKLIEKNKERQEKHEPSGLLSASMLYQPVRFQVLKTLGAPRKEFEPYVLAKFKRGNDVEDWFVKQLSEAGVLIEDKDKLESFNLKLEDDKQAKATYRGAIGYIDSVIDTDQMQSKKGIIPNEIKSVTNAKLKRIKRTGIDWHYQIQACFYALAMGVDHYGVTIVSSEDLRNEIHIFETSQMKKAVDVAIGKYKKAMEDWSIDRTLPPFEANVNVPWTKNIKYAMFEPFWINQSDSRVISKLEELEVI